MKKQPTLPPDYHTHTKLCKHAKGVPLEYLRKAKKKGLSHMATTDHCPSPHDYDPIHRMTMEEMDTYNQWIDEARSKDMPLLLKGIEADFYSGCHLFLSDFLEEQEFDIVLGSIHYQNFWAEKKSERSLFESGDLLSVWKRYFKLVELMAEARLYDIVSHFDLPKKYGSRPPENMIREFVLPALDKIAQAGMGIEINTSGLIHEAKEMYPSPQILAWANERDIPLTFGSDSHTPDRVGADFNKAVILARNAGYSEYVIFNKRVKKTIPLPK